MESHYIKIRYMKIRYMKSSNVAGTGRHGFRAIFALLTLFISGCGALTQAPVLPTLPDWESHAGQARAVENWQIIGKIAIRENNEYNSGSLNWTQQAQHYQIHIAGPLGQGAISIEGNPLLTRLNISGEGSYVTQDPERMLREQIGWTIPLDNLNYWIRGLPAPSSPHRKTLDDHHRLRELFQDDWQVRYFGYLPTATAQLPRKVIISHNLGITITLLVKQWLL